MSLEVEGEAELGLEFMASAKEPEVCTDKQKLTTCLCNVLLV